LEKHAKSTIYPCERVIEDIFYETLGTIKEQFSEFKIQFDKDFKPNIRRIIVTLQGELSSAIRKAAHI
jgi:hypothetical protein